MERKIGETFIYLIYKKQYKLKVIETNKDNFCEGCFFNVGLPSNKSCAKRKRYITGHCGSIFRTDNSYIIFKQVE